MLLWTAGNADVVPARGTNRVLLMALDDMRRQQREHSRKLVASLFDDPNLERVIAGELRCEMGSPLRSGKAMQASRGHQEK
ncbi:hypothetical protein [Kerstersia sp.]|uniref:hypothetical protein n=1 Tax=Kerstersia sp. TaxID=1930783 RepID=UPI003F8E066F